MAVEATPRRCRGCHEWFTISPTRVAEFLAGSKALPRYCDDCRAAHREAQQPQSRSARYRKFRIYTGWAQDGEL